MATAHPHWYIAPAGHRTHDSSHASLPSGFAATAEAAGTQVKTYRRLDATAATFAEAKSLERKNPKATSCAVQSARNANVSVGLVCRNGYAPTDATKNETRTSGAYADANQLSQYVRGPTPIANRPCAILSSRSRTTAWTTLTTGTTNAKTKAKPKKAAANVDPRLVEYAGNGNAFTNTRRGNDAKSTGKPGSVEGPDGVTTGSSPFPAEEEEKSKSPPPRAYAPRAASNAAWTLA